ncbi:MAG: EboA domain-containing protein [Polyangiales bacterium]
MIDSPSVWLWSCLEPRLTPRQLDVLAGESRACVDDRSFFRAFALLARGTGKSAAELAPWELRTAARLCEGWAPGSWRIDELARLWLVLAAHADVDTLVRRVEALFAIADIGELVTLYRGLPLFPSPQRWQARASEGARSNMKDVFEAVALDNPYPARFLQDDAFNQLVLKALHVESPLERIHGLRARLNPRLTAMLLDYVSERRAARRPVDPRLFHYLPLAPASATTERSPS